MYFTAKFASLLLAVAASAQAAVVARSELAELSVVFFDDTFLTGAAYSPSDIAQGVCFTLPDDWLDRPESVIISTGFTCSFYAYQGCAGNGTDLSGTVNELPNPPLYNNIESFICHKS